MRRLSTLIGTLTLTLTLNHASAANLYDSVRDVIERETRSATVEDEVVEFVVGVMRERQPEWKDIAAGDVGLAMRGELSELCAKRRRTSGTSIDLGADTTACLSFARHIADTARREEDLRAFGRRLQVIAARDELPVEGLRGNATDFALHQQAILNIWLAGTGSTKTGTLPAFRSIPLADDALDGQITELRAALNSLPREQMIAAVWRYRHGVRFIRGDRAPLFKPPTIDRQLQDSERQYLLGSWERVEAALNDIWATLLAAAADMRLQNGEFGVILPMPVVPRNGRAQGTKPLLTENVLVWGRIDHDPVAAGGAPGNAARAPVHPLGDVGLLWEFPIEPVLPSLTGTKPILGGAFPPSAEDGQGLCSHPLAKQGYLCRPFERNADGSCLEKAPDDLQAIALTSCTDEAPGEFTLAGPEICSDVRWHSISEDDEQYICSLNVACADVCANDQGILDSSVEWHTYGKTPAGEVGVCIQEGSPGLPPRYDLMRALAVADVVCSEPYTADLRSEPFGCCRIMGEGQQAACRLMVEDGVFLREDGAPAISSEGIPFTLETCTEALTQQACGNESCHVSRNYAPTGEQLFADEIVALAQAGPAGRESCVSALNNADARVAAAINAIDKRDDIGRPGREITLRNSIGNLLCGAGQYLEEAAKRFGLPGGRTPYAIMDQAFPWSIQGLSDPTPEGIGSGVFLPLTAPARAVGSLPSYRPALLAKTFDVALCGEAGLPPRVPPELCMIETQRRLDLPLMSFFTTMQQSISETQDLRGATAMAGQGAVGVGTRMGNGYYAEYVRTALRSLTDVLGSTNDVLDRMRTLTSPGLLCPGPDTPVLEGGSALSAPALKDPASPSSAGR